MDIKTRTENKIRFIKRYIDFCYADFENETIENQNFLFSEIKCMSFGINFTFSMEEFGSPTDEEWEFLKECQKDLKKFLFWLFDSLNHSLKLIFKLPSYFTSGYVRDKTYKFEISSSLGYIDSNLQFRMERNYLEVLANFSAPPKTPERIEIPWIGIELLKAFDGFPNNSLLRCQKCEKIFFNHTKRKQVYCSPKCRNLAGVHRIRKKQREKKI